MPTQIVRRYCNNGGRPSGGARAQGRGSAKNSRTALLARVAARYFQLYRELHAVTQGGKRETIAARTYSTPGDLFGREMAKL